MSFADFFALGRTPKRKTAVPLLGRVVTVTHGIFLSVMPAQTNYVLITPARNEADYIELTLKSVVAQSVVPLKWVIVSDGSTDGTDDLVRKYAADHRWIELLQMPERKERHFAGKALAVSAGHARVG